MSKRNGRIVAVPNSLKLKLREWLALNDALNALDQTNTTLPFTIGLRISYLREHMAKMFEVFNKTKVELLKKHNLLDKKEVTPEEQRPFVEELDPILDEEFEHPFTQINQNELRHLSLTPGVIFALRHLFSRPAVEEVPEPQEVE